MSIGNPPPIDPSLGPSLSDYLVEVQREINRPRKPIFIHAKDFNSAPNITEINSLGIYGVRMSAVGNFVDHIFSVSKDFNVGTNIKIEVVWCTSSANTAYTATWKVLYKATSENEVLSAADIGLGTPITADNVVGSYNLAISPYGVVNQDAFNHGDMLHLRISLSAVTGFNLATDAVFLMGILINDEG